jgi:hypothetical protein
MGLPRQQDQVAGPRLLLDDLIGRPECGDRGVGHARRGAPRGELFQKLLGLAPVVRGCPETVLSPPNGGSRT